MVMIGLTLIGAASAAWEGQGNAPTVRLDPSLWDSLKPGQYRLLDDDVVVARTTRGVFFWRPSAAPTEAHGTGANRDDAALDKIQAALDSILGRVVPPPPAPKPPAKGRREPEAPTSDLERLLASDSEDADSPPPRAAPRLTPEEVAGDLDRLASLAAEYDPACGGLTQRTLKFILAELCAQVEHGYSHLPEGLKARLEPLHGKAPELYEALSKMIHDMEDSTYGAQH